MPIPLPTSLSENNLSKTSQTSREFNYKLSLQNDIIALKNRRQYLDAMTIGPNEQGELLDYRFFGAKLNLK